MKTMIRSLAILAALSLPVVAYADTPAKEAKPAIAKTEKPAKKGSHKVSRKTKAADPAKDATPPAATK